MKQCCKMLKAVDIENFYKHVNSLGIKFPVAAIAKATGFSKGNVSDYLKRVKDPSENFIKKVYQAFPESSKKVPPEQSGGKIEKEAVGQTMTMQMLADVIKGNLELIENNKVLTRINEKHTNMLDEKLPPVNFDLIGLVETVKQLDAKVNLLLRPHIEQAEEDLRQEAGKYVDDRDKEAREIAERFRRSGKHGSGKPGKK